MLHAAQDQLIAEQRALLMLVIAKRLFVGLTGHFILITTRILRSIQPLKHLKQLLELALLTPKILTITTPSMEKFKVN